MPGSADSGRPTRAGARTRAPGRRAPARGRSPRRGGAGPGTQARRTVEAAPSRTSYPASRATSRLRRTNRSRRRCRSSRVAGRGPPPAATRAGRPTLGVRLSAFCPMRQPGESPYRDRGCDIDTSRADERNPAGLVEAGTGLGGRNDDRRSPPGRGAARGAGRRCAGRALATRRRRRVRRALRPLSARDSALPQAPRSRPRAGRGPHPAGLPEGVAGRAPLPAARRPVLGVAVSDGAQPDD